MSSLRNWTKSDNMMAYLAVVAIRLIYAVMFMISKVVFDDGMNNNIFVFYRQVAGTLFLSPFALFYGWKSAPPLSFKTFCKIFLLAFFGVTLSLNFNALGLVYTTPAIIAASSNIIPVITFVLAVLFRMEMLKWKTKSGVAKVAGIIFCAGGVAVLAFYNGPSFKIIPPENQLVHTREITHETHHSTMTWVKGCLSLIAGHFCWASWIVFQGSVLSHYQSKLLFTTLQCFLSMFQSFFIAIVFERDLQEWKLGWNFRLVAVLYCGVMVTGVGYYLQSYVIQKKGPVFLSITMPLTMIITVIASTLILGELLSLRSIIGGTLLVLGLYSVLWGKSKDPELRKEIEIIHTSEVKRDVSNRNDVEKVETDEV